MYYIYITVGIARSWRGTDLVLTEKARFLNWSFTMIAGQSDAPSSKGFVFWGAFDWNSQRLMNWGSPIFNSKHCHWLRHRAPPHWGTQHASCINQPGSTQSPTQAVEEKREKVNLYVDRIFLAACANGSMNLWFWLIGPSFCFFWGHPRLGAGARSRKHCSKCRQYRPRTTSCWRLILWAITIHCSYTDCPVFSLLTDMALHVGGWPGGTGGTGGRSQSPRSLARNSKGDIYLSQ